MCGRYTSTHDGDALAERFAASVPESFTRRYNVAPTDQTLTIVERGEEVGRVAAMMRWGLVPYWAKDTSTSARMINARAETILQRSAYRKLVESRRCLVPADGYYEWQVGPDGKKQPIRFTLAGENLFAFAGLWTSWVDRGSGELIDSCTIVTTTPNELVALVHDRMPVILPREAEPAWLDVSIPPREVAPLLATYPAELMLARPASTRVNSAREDDPGLLDPDG